MKRNQLGSSSLYVSEIGFGTMSLSDDQGQNERILQEAFNQGVNFFDTADLYQFGMNEKSVGKALGAYRDKIILASKGGNDWHNQDGGWIWNPKKSYLKEAVKASLKRLNTDYLDLYQLHGGTTDDPFDEVVEAFQEMKQDGLIRAWGISSIRPNVIRRFVENTDIDSVMMQYSLLDRRPEEWMNLFKKHQISIISRGPIAKGLLADSWRKRDLSNGYLDYNESELNDVLPRIEEEAGKLNMPMQQLALRYVIDQPEVATAIPGASSLEQVHENCAASEKEPLSSKPIGALRLMTKEGYYDKHR